MTNDKDRGDELTIAYLLGVRHGREDERAKIAAETSQPTQSDEEAYYLGKRDGYETAVQDIDMLTGGDGEYCYSTIEGERHCPNPDSMKARIAERFNSQPTQSDALRDLVAALYCASGCSCCRDDDAWEKASDELGQLFNIPKYKNGYGYDWHSVHEAALQEQSK